MNIARKGVDLDTRCAVCHKYFEDGGHLFLKCKLAKQRWRAMLLEDVRLKLLPCANALELLQEVLNLSTDEQLLTVAFLWSWWNERNKGNHGEKHQPIDQFQFTVTRHRDDWKQFLGKKESTETQPVCVWEPPPVDFVKINTDASFRENVKAGGWGAICSDSQETSVLLQLELCVR